MAYVEAPIDRNSLEPDSNGGGGNITNHKLKDGSNLFRILPPFGTNHGGRLFSEWLLHWGFTDKNNRAKPLVCTKRYENYCPICEAASEVYNDKQTLVREYQYTDKDGKPKTDWKSVPADTKAKYEELNTTFNQLKAQRGYYFNALNTNGEIGLLRLPKTAKDALCAVIKDALDRLDINPVAFKNGCLINIQKIKTGSNIFDVEYKASLFKKVVKTADGKVMEEIEQSAVPESISENYDKRAIDVHAFYKIRSSAVLNQIMRGDTTIFETEAAEKQAKMSSKKTEPTPTEVVANPPINTTTNNTPIASTVNVPVNSPVIPPIEAAKTPVVPIVTEKDAVLENLKRTFLKGSKK